MKNKLRIQVIVDMLYDFIDGTLACEHAKEAVTNTVNYLNNLGAYGSALYVCDNHPKNHCSFKENGGEWPAHCVKGTHGAEISNKFKKVEILSPNKYNIFYKGASPDKEEYSGFNAKRIDGVSIERAIGAIEGFFNLSISTLKDSSIEISGIATEFCIKNTALDFLNAGHNVSIIKDNLGWVNKENHEKTLQELSKLGIKII